MYLHNCFYYRYFSLMYRIFHYFISNDPKRITYNLIRTSIIVTSFIIQFRFQYIILPIHVYTYIHTRTYIYIYIYIHIYIYAHTRSNANIFLHNAHIQELVRYASVKNSGQFGAHSKQLRLGHSPPEVWLLNLFPIRVCLSR